MIVNILVYIGKIQSKAVEVLTNKCGLFQIQLGV